MNKRTVEIQYFR